MSDDSQTPPPAPKPVSKLVCFPCLAFLLLAGLGSAGLTLGFFESLRASIPYEQGLAVAQADPRAREALGEPIRAGWWVYGVVEDAGQGGSATLVLPLEGPRGKGTLRLAASKSGGLWSQRGVLLSLEPQGETLDLLPPSSEAGPATSPGAAGKD